jgi:arginine metabolism regulation protein II
MELFEACEALRVNILTWEISSEQFHFAGTGNIMIEIAAYQARAFHSAVLIYFHRTVLNEDPGNLEDEVGFILNNLTDAEDLKDRCMGGDKRTAPMSWPAFIASCEASDRQPWVEWWTRIQEYKIGNFRRQWMVVQELWDIMDKDDNVNNWKEALEKSGILVLPI